MSAAVSAGTYCNPVIWADVPDPDVIRVGEDFYMVSTTMHLMPGCPVMKSRDLVNWETVGYVFDTLNDTPRYGLEGAPFTAKVSGRHLCVITTENSMRFFAQR